MNGVIVDKNTRRIITFVRDVVEVTDTKLVGKVDNAVLGDPVRGEIIITSNEYKLIDENGAYLDVYLPEDVQDERHLLPVNPVEQRMNEMQANYDQAIMELTMLIAMNQGV
jgi:hypothetical protein